MKTGMLPFTPKSAAQIPQAVQTHDAMGTVMTHKAFGPQAEDSIAAVRKEVARIEGLLSRFLPGSDISRVNRAAGMQTERVSLDTLTVLSKALEISRSFPGCFDITIEPLVRVWSAGKQTLALPDEESIRQALLLVDSRGLILDPWERTVGLRDFGQGIDLGGIGKGYAGDQILKVFRQYGVTSAYSNLGGNVVTLGAKPDGSPWRVGIQHPRQENRLIGSLAVADQSVVTSGDYQRCYTDREGRRHHHILNPRTGYPAQAGLVSVTVVARQSLAADALSTSLFVAGLEKGRAYLRNFPEIEAVFVDSDLQVLITPGLEARFQAEQGVGVTVLDR